MDYGLAVYRSAFWNSEGGRGLVGGPHPAFTQYEKNFHVSPLYPSTYVVHQVMLALREKNKNPSSLLCLGDRASKARFYEDLNCEPEESHLSNLVNECMCEKISSNPEVNAFMVKRMKAFNAVEDAGTVISYRCVGCRKCKGCKEGELYENISLSEEVQQDVVIKAVSINLVENVCISRLHLCKILV